MDKGKSESKITDRLEVVFIGACIGSALFLIASVGLVFPIFEDGELGTIITLVVWTIATNLWLFLVSRGSFNNDFLLYQLKKVIKSRGIGLDEKPLYLLYIGTLAFVSNAVTLGSLLFTVWVK